jgi:AsmA protein
MRRFILILLSLIIVLIVGSAVLIPMLIDKDEVLELAITTIKEQTGATLTVGGDTDLSLFPTIGITLSDAAVTLPEKTEPDIHLRLLEIGVQFMPLLTGKVQIDTFNVDGLDAKIEMVEEKDTIDTSTMSDAELDAFYAQRAKGIEAAGEAAGAGAAPAVPLALNVNRLTISDAKVELIDPSGAPSTHIELVSLEASGLNLDGRSIPLNVFLRLPGEQPMEITVSSELTIDMESEMANLDDLNLTVVGATPEPLKVLGKAAVDISRQIADLDIKIELGEMRGEGTIHYANYETPQIDNILHFNLFDPALLVVAGPEAVEAATEGEATTGDEPLPLDSMRSIDTRAVLTIDKARFDVHTINNLKVKLRAKNGVINLKQLSGELHGGQLNAQAVFNGKHNTAILDTKGGITALDIATAVTATGSEAQLSGKADFTWDLTSEGSTANELTGAMNGPIELATQEVLLAGTSVEKMLCQAVALTNGKTLSKPFSKDTSIKSLGAKIQLADGNAVIKPLEAKLTSIGLTGGGDFNLLSSDFSMDFKAAISKELGNLDPACEVSNKLTKIDWPVACKGNTTGEPGDWCSVDSKSILKELTMGEGKEKVQKEAGKFFNKFFK